MHYVANVEREYPVIRAVIFHTQCAPRRYLKLLLDLQLAHLFKRLE